MSRSFPARSITHRPPAAIVPEAFTLYQGGTRAPDEKGGFSKIYRGDVSIGALLDDLLSPCCPEILKLFTGQVSFLADRVRVV